MSAPVGYNPSATLLPAAGGTIHAMSGGGALDNYNPSASLVPLATAPIAPFRGGRRVRAVKGGQPGFSAALDAANKKVQEEHKSDPDERKEPESVVQENNPPKETSLLEKKEPESVVNAEEKPPKEISFLGNLLVLEYPTEKQSVWTDSQKQLLTSLHVSDADDKFKYDLIKAVYDGVCSTDKPLIMLMHCEPLRRLIRSLALHLRKKITKQYGPSSTPSSSSSSSSSVLLSFAISSLDKSEPGWGEDPGGSGLLAIAPSVKEAQKPFAAT